MRKFLFASGISILFLLSSCSYYIGKARLAHGFQGDPPSLGNVFEDIYSAKNDFDPNDPLITKFANEPLPPIAEVGRHDVLRPIIAKLVQHKDVQQVNEYLMNLKPWARPGTDWALHKHGDYDFNMPPFCIILYLFDNQPEVLYPKTQEHIVHDLLIHDKHWKALRTPGTLGILRETENHIFQSEISRYLQNQWLHEHGDSSKLHDNVKNGMEQWMISHVKKKLQGGFYEFNSIPYSGYSLTAVLALYSYTHSDSVRLNTGRLLNQMVLEYALGSLGQRRYPPFRRRLERERVKTFDEDALTSIIRTLLPSHDGLHVNYESFAFTALVMRYRLNDELKVLLGDRPDRVRQAHPEPPVGHPELVEGEHKQYFVTFGHGILSSPEMYSGGHNYLISAGGVQRGKVSQLVAHPTVLFLPDKVMHLDSCFYLPGSGEMKEWNNTGVYDNFACGPQPVHIPIAYKPVYEKEGWQVFSSYPIYIIVHQRDDLGLLFIDNDVSYLAEEAVNRIIAQNKNLDLYHKAVTPQGDTITYDLHAPKNKWVIKSVNGKKVDRRFDKWGRIRFYKPEK